MRKDRGEKSKTVNLLSLTQSPVHYKKCRISLLALIKMLHHGTKDGIIEVMGYLRGKVQGDTFYIMDSYPLPVEGTETRVNAGNEALEYTGAYEDLNEVRRSRLMIGYQAERERCRLVSHPSKLRPLVVGHRRQHSEIDVERRRSIYCDRSGSDQNSHFRQS